MRCPVKGKLSYGSQAEADTALERVKGKSTTRGKRLTTYVCPFCCVWHLGNRGHGRKKKTQPSELRRKARREAARAALQAGNADGSRFGT